MNKKFLSEFLELSGKINLIYGPAGSGKTTLAKLEAIKKIREGKRVLFLDTENGFSVKRFKQLARKDYKQLLKNIFLIKINNFEDQCKRIDKLFSVIEMFSLVIIDTIGSHYRGVLQKDVYGVNKRMDGQLRTLKVITKKGICVLITNQVYSDFEKGIRCVGGDMVKNWCDCLIRLEKNPRKLILEKPEKKEFLFKIKEDGVYF